MTLRFVSIKLSACRCALACLLGVPLFLFGVDASAEQPVRRLADASQEGPRDGLDARFQQGMHVVLTGVGARFSIQEEGGSGVLVIVDGEVLQFDMGPMTVDRLAQVGVHPKAVDHLFISHLHMDHISDFPRFISIHKHTGGQVRVYGPAGTRNMTQGADQFLSFDNDMMSRMTTLSLAYPVTDLTKSGVVLSTEKTTVTAAQTAHLDIPGPYSFAYRVDSEYGSVVISGDTVPSLNVVDLAKGADLLIHEAVFDESMYPPPDRSDGALAQLTPYGREIVRRPTIKLADGARTDGFGHSEISEVAKVADKAGVGKLVLYHRPPVAATQAERDLVDLWGLSKTQADPALIAAFLAAASNNFDGPIVMGMPLTVFEIVDTDKKAE